MSYSAFCELKKIGSPEFVGVTRRLKYLWAIFTNDRQRTVDEWNSSFTQRRKVEGGFRNSPEGRSRFVEFFFAEFRSRTNFPFFQEEEKEKKKKNCVPREAHEPSARPFETPNRGISFIYFLLLFKPTEGVER